MLFYAVNNRIENEFHITVVSARERKRSPDPHGVDSGMVMGADYINASAMRNKCKFTQPFSDRINIPAEHTDIVNRNDNYSASAGIIVKPESVNIRLIKESLCGLFSP